MQFQNSMDTPSDHRQFLLRLLNDYIPSNEADRRNAADLKQFVESNIDCFERTNLKGHVTGSAWVLNANGSAVLLTHHKKLNKWLQLGGHADGEANVLNVALREAREESGLSEIEPVTTAIFDVDVHPIPARHNEPAHLHYDVRFILKATGPQTPAASGESHQVAWVPLSDLSRFSTEESMHRMAEKWRLLSKTS